MRGCEWRKGVPEVGMGKIALGWCGCLQSRPLSSLSVRPCFKKRFKSHILTSHHINTSRKISSYLFYICCPYATGFFFYDQGGFFLLSLRTMSTMDNPLFPPWLVLIHSVSTLRKWSQGLKTLSPHGQKPTKRFYTHTHARVKPTPMFVGRFYANVYMSSP